jgi:excisionase family DNA binding protein
MQYRLLNGDAVDIELLPKEDLAFLLDLQRRAMEGQDYFSLAFEVSGAGAYPLKGSPRVTRDVHESPLFRVAEDIADRTGINQGALAPEEGDQLRIIDEILSTREAAERLGITRSAVIKAARAGRLLGKKIGNSWALLRRSVDSYQVASYRVEAGKAAHRR